MLRYITRAQQDRHSHHISGQHSLWFDNIPALCLQRCIWNKAQGSSAEVTGSLDVVIYGWARRRPSSGLLSTRDAPPGSASAAPAGLASVRVQQPWNRGQSETEEVVPIIEQRSWIPGAWHLLCQPHSSEMCASPKNGVGMKAGIIVA